ncbi:MAG: ABC transporter permease, partial [Gammaproteobacteria bacterium]
MTQGLQVLGLAFKDYSHEWRMSGCYILGLAAVLAPLMVLFGLKFGVITGMVTALTEDPRNREIRPVGSGHYEADWFETMRVRPEVSFVIPRTRTLAATVDLRSEQASNIVSAELLPSAGTDPLLVRVRRHPQGLSKVVLSASAAQRLEVAAGGLVEASIARRYQGRPERVRFKLTVVDVLNEAAFSRPAVFSTLELVTAAESFRDGRAVAAMGWSGTEPDAGGRSYPSFRLYARSIYDVPGLAQELITAGQKVKTNAADIETVISIDRNLALVFWIIALAGMAGFSLSLGAS